MQEAEGGAGAAASDIGVQVKGGAGADHFLETGPVRTIEVGDGVAVAATLTKGGCRHHR